MGRNRAPQKTERSDVGDAQGALPKDLFLLDPEVVFLNHGSFGATPRPVFEQYQAWQRELERQPVEFLGRRFADLLREARSVLAAHVLVSTGS